MKKDSEILRLSLLAGTIYFSLIAIVHLLGLKVPILFIYYGIPSYSYQDKITALFSFGWAVFFYTAYKDPVGNMPFVRAIIYSGLAAIMILCLINLTTNFSLLSKSFDVFIVWMETLLLFLYWLWIVIFYFRSKRFINSGRL